MVLSAFAIVHASIQCFRENMTLRYIIMCSVTEDAAQPDKKRRTSDDGMLFGYCMSSSYH
jgi:hypothetical protein